MGPGATLEWVRAAILREGFHKESHYPIQYVLCLIALSGNVSTSIYFIFCSAFSHALNVRVGVNER